MSGLSTLLALQAADRQLAVPRASMRHVHLAPRPLVVVGYHLAGDVGAPLALLWGTDRDSAPQCIVVPEPRNRQLRFEQLEIFGNALLSYLEGFTSTETVQRGKTLVEVCVDAPQLVVANPATAAWLFGIVGRFTRAVRTDGDNPAPPIVPIAGKHLSFFSDPLPGSNLVLAGTDILEKHWQSGQLPSEDQNLGALLAWISPPTGIPAPVAARVAERRPPAGPASDPHWDADELSALIARWHAADTDAERDQTTRDLEAEAREQLTQAWQDCGTALQLLEELPEAAHVEQRWQRDRDAWTRHTQAMASDQARFRNISSPLQAARRLRRLEDATAELERQMALDDPVKMADLVADGEALFGEVKRIDTDRRVIGTSGRRTRRPLIELTTDLEFSKPIGTILHPANTPSIYLRVLSANDLSVSVEVTRGALTAATMPLLPSVGDSVILSPFGDQQFYPDPALDGTPWTHVMPNNNNDDEEEEAE